MTIEIRRHPPGGDLRAFIDLPSRLYDGDRGWTPPLRGESKKQLDPSKNPFFHHADVALFTAWKDGVAVGRCSAQINREHLKHHDDRAGFFGLFDTVDDPEVAGALLTQAESWCASRGMRRLRGPFSLCINEEVGIMVEGFDAPSMMLTPYHRPYQGGLIERAGFRQVKDVLTWQHDIGRPPARAMRAYERIMAMEEVTIRPVRKRRLEEEMAVVRRIFNEAWCDNWGFVPWTDAEFAKTVADFKMILNERLALIAEINGEPVAICICLPNLNDWICDLSGRLGPLGLCKMLWRSKCRPPESAKLPLMGLCRSVRRHRRYAGLATAMCVAIYRELDRLDARRAELGWTLDDNHLVNSVISRIGGEPVKRHRIYEKALSP